MPIGGLDIGSTSTKITVLDGYGQLLFTEQRGYPTSRDAKAHEVDADDIWRAASELVRSAAAAVPDLSAVGVTSFGESFVLLDEQGEAILPVMMYTDPRGTEEAERLREALGDERIGALVGVEPHSMYSLPKLMWVKRHRPDAYARARFVCLVADFVAFRLTGSRLIDHSLAARTMGLDIRRKQWSAEVFAAAGIDPALFPKPVPTGSLAGAVLPDVARSLGLSRRLDVVLCGHDQVAAAVGSGVLRPGTATDGGGTVQCMTPVFSSVPEGNRLQRDHYVVVPFLQDAYCCYAFSFTGGALVKWFVDSFADRYRALAEQRSVTVYQALEEQMEDAPTGILVLPHFAGAATPYMDTGSKGAFVGLELYHTPVQLYQAILEGIGYEMRLNRDALAMGGISITALNATGGCAKSKRWLQMKADILGVPVSRMGVSEAGTVGGIMLTGVAVGQYASLEEARARLVQKKEVYTPRPELHSRYDACYRRYRRLYDAVRPLVDE